MVYTDREMEVPTSYESHGRLSSMRSSAGSTHQRILVVDDESDLRELLQHVLTGAGYEVATVPDGHAALEYLRSSPAPDLILLDLMMPRLDGWKFCEIRRDDPALSAIPVVIVSARGGPSRTSPYIGVSAIVSKPFDVEALVEAVQQFTA